eukprot:scaffold79259_cov24-Prasinocladus_malaysianus.AAC.1
MPRTARVLITAAFDESCVTTSPTCCSVAAFVSEVLVHHLRPPEKIYSTLIIIAVLMLDRLMPGSIILSCLDRSRCSLNCPSIWQQCIQLRLKTANQTAITTIITQPLEDSWGCLIRLSLLLGSPDDGRTYQTLRCYLLLIDT